MKKAQQNGAEMERYGFRFRLVKSVSGGVILIRFASSFVLVCSRPQSPRCVSSMAASVHPVRVGESILGPSTDSFHSVRCESCLGPLIVFVVWSALNAVWVLFSHRNTDNFKPESIASLPGTFVAKSAEDDAPVQVELPSSTVSVSIAFLCSFYLTCVVAGRRSALFQRQPAPC
jgi:hypothetical protein